MRGENVPYRLRIVKQDDAGYVVGLGRAGVYDLADLSVGLATERADIHVAGATLPIALRALAAELEKPAAGERWEGVVDEAPVVVVHVGGGYVVFRGRDYKAVYAAPVDDFLNRYRRSTT